MKLSILIGRNRVYKLDEPFTERFGDGETRTYRYGVAIDKQADVDMDCDIFCETRNDAIRKANEWQ